MLVYGECILSIMLVMSVNFVNEVCLSLLVRKKPMNAVKMILGSRTKRPYIPSRRINPCMVHAK